MQSTVGHETEKAANSESVDQIFLFDDTHRRHFLPLAWTRPMGDFRIGIGTIAEQWAAISGWSTAFLAPDFLQGCYLLPDDFAQGTDVLCLNGRLLPDAQLWEALAALEPGQGWQDAQGIPLAFRPKANQHLRYATSGEGAGLLEAPDLQWSTAPEGAETLNHPWELFARNGQYLTAEFERRTADQSSAVLSASNTAIGSHPIFLEPGASAEGAFFDLREGPIYLAAGSEVMPGCLVRGPFALGEKAVLKMGTKIYGPTTIGPGCKVGGEVNNCILHSHSNKAHDGFLGNSVIGSWCNLGADTNTSNLKNDYGPVRIHSEAEGGLIDTGRQFCGLFMADHAKAGINTMFNTGTVVGVSANVFGAGFPPKFIPSFSWGGVEGLVPYRLDKAQATAQRVWSRRKKDWGAAEQALFAHVFAATAAQREA